MGNKKLQELEKETHDFLNSSTSLQKIDLKLKPVFAASASARKST
jgi:hypothetical protein